MSKNRMWNFDKVQKDYLNKLLKGDREWFAAADNENFTAAKPTENVYISDGHFVVAIPQTLCMINYQVPEHTKISADAFKKMIDMNNYSRFEIEELSDTKTTMQQDRQNIRMLKNSDGEDIWINEKYTKYFEDMNVKYYGRNPHGMVFVKVNERIIGCILPIAHH